jgi:hypothetical protein
MGAPFHHPASQTKALDVRLAVEANLDGGVRGGGSLPSDLRESTSAEERRFFPVYLYGPISRVTLAGFEGRN